MVCLGRKTCLLRALLTSGWFWKHCIGIGWGMGGICPGPALVFLGTKNIEGMIFVGAMLSG